MRLQLTVACALALASSLAHAEPEGDHVTVVGRNSLYADDDDTIIDTSTIAIHAKPTEKLTINAHYVADAVSSASVDVVTAATKRWDELRSEVRGGAAFADGTNTASADYLYSHEEDWDSHTIALAGSRDLYSHNLTLGAAGSYGTNRVGRADDENFSERMTTMGGALRVVWVATKHDIFNASYDLSRVSGYQASPYRYAYVANDNGVPIAFEETVPELRMRHAATLRWNHHLLRDSALRSHLRLYTDDWGVRSLTTGTEYVHGFAPFEVSANVRVYAQQHAAFYQDVYDAPRMFMTADRELSSFQDLFAGVRAAWIGESLSIDASFTGFAFRFPEFSRLPRRTGFTAAIGVVWAL